MRWVLLALMVLTCLALLSTIGMLVALAAGFTAVTGTQAAASATLVVVFYTVGHLVAEAC